MNDSPEEILKSLGIADPSDIDVDAIAWHLGAIVKYLPLEQCEARIVGLANKAIITINSNSSAARQRFSVGHEIGHWVRHRNRLLLCQADQIEIPTIGASNAERIADRFAADLLMPKYVLAKLVQSIVPSFSIVLELAKIFRVSLRASAIRVVETAGVPSVLVCHNMRGRRWFTKSPHVPEEWMPQFELRGDSLAFSVLFGNVRKSAPKRVGAQLWFQQRDAPRFEVTEESIQAGAKEILTILNFVGKTNFS